MLKICLIASHGGHLRELLDVTAAVQENKFYVTYKTIYTEEILEKLPHYFIIDPHKSFWKFLLNALQSLFRRQLVLPKFALLILRERFKKKQ